MESNIITKTLNKVNEQPKEYSLGFKRLTSLPLRVRRNINLACILKGENNQNSVIKMLNELSEIEFINWLKLA